MEPYQRASEAIVSGNETPIQLAKNLALTAVGGGVMAASKKLLPAIGSMLSPYIPDSIFRAGMSKIHPKLGSFVEKALSAGYTHDDLRTFLGEKIEKDQQQAQKEKKNIVQKYSPELHDFITQLMKSGRSHTEAGALAGLSRKGKTDFKPIIDKISKDYKSSWGDLVEEIYGGSQQPPQDQQQPQQDQQQLIHAQEARGPSAGDRRLMQMMEAINKRLGA